MGRWSCCCSLPRCCSTFAVSAARKYSSFFFFDNFSLISQSQIQFTNLDFYILKFDDILPEALLDCHWSRQQHACEQRLLFSEFSFVSFLFKSLFLCLFFSKASFYVFSFTSLFFTDFLFPASFYVFLYLQLHCLPNIIFVLKKCISWLVLL